MSKSLKSGTRQFFVPAAIMVAMVLGATAPATAKSFSTTRTAVIVQTNFVEDVGGSERINLSGKLRMLSQRVVAAACYYQAGIDPDRSLATLTAATQEFATITQALEFGNADLGVIGSEERGRTLAGIERLNNLWTPVAALADKVAAGEGSLNDVVEIAEQSAPLLEMAKLLVSIISAQYSNQAELLMTDALAIDIAGRQRMLSQRMSKNTCLAAQNLSTETAVAELAGAAEMFDVSLNILYNGDASVGIAPPRNETISSGLEVVLARWATLQPIVERALTTGDLDDEQLAIMFNGANAMTGEMNVVVGEYSAASKLGL